MVPHHGSQGEDKTEKATATASFTNSQTRLSTALDVASLDKPWVPALLEQYYTVTYYNSWQNCIFWATLTMMVWLEATAAGKYAIRYHHFSKVLSRYKCSAQYWYNSSRGWAKPLSRRLTGPQMQELSSWQGPGKGSQTRYCWYWAGKKDCNKSHLKWKMQIYLWGDEDEMLIRL